MTSLFRVAKFIICFLVFISFNHCMSQDIFYCDTSGILDRSNSLISIKCEYYFNFFTNTKDSVVLSNVSEGEKQLVKINAVAVHRVLNGPVCYYVGDTVLFMKGFMKEGKADSVFLGYQVSSDYSKKQTFRSNFKNGAKDGQEFEYYDNGSVKYIRNYKNGLLDGKFKLMDEFANSVSEGNYKKGKKVDTWLEADPPRRIAVYQNYQNGKMVGYTWTSYYKNGKLFITGSYDKKDRKEGVFEIYDQQGELMSTENYRKGKLCGYSITYYKGKPIR